MLHPHSNSIPVIMVAAATAAAIAAEKLYSVKKLSNRPATYLLSRCRKKLCIASCRMSESGFVTLLYALTLLCQCVAAQFPPAGASTCSACVALNSASIYVGPNDPASSKTFSTGTGSPSVVWCSAEPSGSSGTCDRTTFIVANVQMQCGGWSNVSHSFSNPSQASPCPAAAPYAFFQSCDCTRTCKYQGLAFDGFGQGQDTEGFRYVARSFAYAANVLNLLRSCDLCIAGGGEWWSASDMTSNACSNMSLIRDHDCCRYSGWQQTVVPSCHAPGQRFLSAAPGSEGDWSSIPDVNIFQPAFRYSTSHQCSHGSSFCSSINLSGANCVVMIALLVNIPLTAIYMRLSCSAINVYQSMNQQPGSCHQIVSATLWIFAFIHDGFVTSCSATTPLARRRNIVAEFAVTYIFWPVALAVALLPSIIAAAFGAFLLIIYAPYMACQSCWAFCGGESNSSAPSAEMREVVAPRSDTGTIDTLVGMQDDELSPLIFRHVEACTHELRCQFQEMDARSRRMEAQLNELLARGAA